MTKKVFSFTSRNINVYTPIEICLACAFGSISLQGKGTLCQQLCIERERFVRIPSVLLQVLSVAQWGTPNIFLRRQWRFCKWRCDHALKKYMKLQERLRGMLMRLIATKLSSLRTMKFAWMLGTLSIAYRR